MDTPACPLSSLPAEINNEGRVRKTMETSIVVIRPETEEEDIKRAGDILKRGGLVAFLTIL